MDYSGVVVVLGVGLAWRWRSRNSSVETVVETVNKQYTLFAARFRSLRCVMSCNSLKSKFASRPDKKRGVVYILVLMRSETQYTNNT